MGRKRKQSSTTVARSKTKKQNKEASMFATKSVAKTSVALAPRGIKASRVNRARFVAVRAAEEPKEVPAPEGNAATPPPPPPPAPKAPTFGDAMAFAGSAPETVNGRLAMLGFIAALGAEASSGETVFQQVGDAEPSILFAFIMFAAASLIPILKGVKKEKFAFFSPEAEMLNGRAAMIGFALLLALEAKSGAAFF